MNTDPQTEACIADLASDRFSHVVFDFDQTLFLDNSTERFLDALRPRVLAFLIVACTDWLMRLLAWIGAVKYDNVRDFARVLACTVLLPWNHFLWPGAARRLAASSMNRALLDPLPPERPVIVLSYGFRHVIAPILQAARLARATLICSDALPPFTNLRSSGKLKALEALLPVTEWDKALFITDSEDDAEVMAALPRSRMMKWCPRSAPAFEGLYLPLRYTVEGKYPGCRYFTSQIVLEDLLLLWLAYAFSWNFAAALGGLFLSLYTIYEIGYHENDHVARAYEDTPVVSGAAARFPTLPKVKPWVWALVFAVAGILSARPEYALHPWNMKWAFLIDVSCWIVLLAGLRVVFGVFNRRPPIKRLSLFPLLHLFKTFSFVMLIPLTAVGAVLLAAQVISISANYFLYRLGGGWQRFPRQRWRMILFIAGAGIMILAAPAAAMNAGPLRWFLIPLWGSVRMLEETKHKNILRLVIEGFRAGEPPASRHDEARKEE